MKGVVVMTKNNGNNKFYTIIVAMGITILLGMALLALMVVEHNANNKLLHRLKIPQPGTNIELVMSQLGSKMWDTSDVEVMRHWGSIKNPSFLQDKKLFVFSVSAPPSRTMEIYTDTNNIIVFVTWQPL